MNSSPLDPLSRRLLGAAGLLAVLLIAVVVNYLLHEGSEVLNPVAQAAQRTAAMPGARLKMEVTYTVEGNPQKIVGTGVGAVNARTDRERVVLNVPRAGGGSMVVHAVGNDRVVYIKSAELAAQLPAGRQWLAMEPLLGHSSRTAFGSSAGAGRTMKMLEAFDGHVEEVDHQLVRGKQTTHYKATLDMSSVSQALGERGEKGLAKEYDQVAQLEPTPIPVEVWVDEAGRVRLLRLVQQLPTEGGGPAVTMDMRVENLAFGAQPKIKLPSGHRVFDYTPVLRAELGMLDGHDFGPVEPPGGAKPLAASVFRRRVDAICRGAYVKAKALQPRSEELVDRIKSLGPDELLSSAGRPTLIAVGRWTEGTLGRLERQILRQMAAVAPPASDAANYRRYLTLEAMEGEWTLAGARMFQLGVPKTPNADAHKAEAKRQKKERKALVRSLGIGACEKPLKGGADTQSA